MHGQRVRDAHDHHDVDHDQHEHDDEHDHYYHRDQHHE